MIKSIIIIKLKDITMKAETVCCLQFRISMKKSLPYTQILGLKLGKTNITLTV